MSNLVDNNSPDNSTKLIACEQVSDKDAGVMELVEQELVIRKRHKHADDEDYSLDALDYVISDLGRARSAKAESPWVPIKDIPEEWKDGRGLDLYHRQFGRMLNCGPTFLNALDNITHAMLPPLPPKEAL